jgi:hypothetical protein
VNPSYCSSLSAPFGVFSATLGLLLSSIAISSAAVYIAQQTASYNTGATMIQNTSANSNFNPVSPINIGFSSSTSALSRGLFEFDLTAIETAAAGNPFTIDSVTLTLVTGATVGIGATASGFSLYTLGANSDFDETTVTWNNAPSVAGGSFPASALSTLSFVPATASTTRTFASTAAFTAAVASALSTDAANTVRFLLKADDETAGYLARFNTDENATASNRPALTINYTVVPETSASILLIAGAGMGILRRRR